jgi:hypothetical protein
VNDAPRDASTKTLVDPELGTARREKTPRTGRRMIDLTNWDEVYALACRLAEAPERDLHLVSMRELRALAVFARACGTVTWQASELTAHSDAGSPRDVIVGQLEKLAAITRPLIGREVCTS